MRGFVYPPNPQCIDWSRAMKSKKKNRGPRAFLEALMLGRNFQVFAHIIIPTGCSLRMDDARDKTLELVWQYYEPNKLQRKALRAQNAIMYMCAICDVALEKNPDRPYQLALRLMGGHQMQKPETWNYELLMAVLCRKCQTRPTEALLLVTEFNYIDLAELIARYGFGREEDVDLAEFLEQEQGSLVRAIASSYLWRMERVNEHSVEGICAIRSKQGCYHCGSSSSPIEQCQACGGVIGYCRTSISPLYPLVTCRTFGWNVEQHASQLCLEIKKMHLFHTESAHYILKEFTADNGVPATAAPPASLL